MHKLWLIFAQTVTIVLAALFVVSTLRPELLPWQSRGGGGAVVTIKEAASDTTRPNAPQLASFSDAAQKAMPSVVNVFTSKEVKIASHPLMEDPMFRRFFGDRFENFGRFVTNDVTAFRNRAD